MCLPNILSPVFMFAFIFHCRSFSLWWPLAFSLSHSRFECSCFSSYKIRPLFFSITRSNSFSVIHVSVNIKNNAEKDTTLLLFKFSFLLSGQLYDFFPNKTLSCISVAIPVDWIILHRYTCGADGLSGGRLVGRCTVMWLPNFLGWVVYHTFLPTVLRRARFAHESSAKTRRT